MSLYLDSIHVSNYLYFIKDFKSKHEKNFEDQLSKLVLAKKFHTLEETRCKELAKRLKNIAARIETNKGVQEKSVQLFLKVSAFMESTIKPWLEICLRVGVMTFKDIDSQSFFEATSSHVKNNETSTENYSKMLKMK